MRHEGRPLPSFCQWFRALDRRSQLRGQCRFFTGFPLHPRVASQAPELPHIAPQGRKLSIYSLGLTGRFFPPLYHSPRTAEGNRPRTKATAPAHGTRPSKEKGRTALKSGSIPDARRYRVPPEPRPWRLSPIHHAQVRWQTYRPRRILQPFSLGRECSRTGDKAAVRCDLTNGSFQSYTRL